MKFETFCVYVLDKRFLDINVRSMLKIYVRVGQNQSRLFCLPGNNELLTKTHTKLKIGTLKRTCVYCEFDLKSEQLEVNVSN